MGTQKEGSMTEFQFLLKDRIQKIKSINDKYDLENKSYLSFSGGKDSTALSVLLDLALPKNNIPRVYINTGIDYKDITKFIKSFGEKDSRLKIISPTQNLKEIFETFGYPFKSKEHSQKVALFQRSGFKKTVKDYIGEGNKKNFLCPKVLRYNFSEEFQLKVSDKCCYKLKKEPAEKWSEENKRPITITGLRKTEGGLRKSVSSCTIFSDKEATDLKKFHPLLPMSDDFIDTFIKEFKIELCKLYSPPYNFERTGCKGCPYSIDLERQLKVMGELLPEERKQCETLWNAVYSEYRRIGYRLRTL